MDNPFDRRNRPGLQIPPFHDRRIHPPHPVELHMRASPCIEQPALLQHADHLLDSGQRRRAAIQEMVADFQCGGETAGLSRGHATETGAAMDEKEGAGRFQLSNKPFTR